MIQASGNPNPSTFLILDHPHGEDYKTNYAISGYVETQIKSFCYDTGQPYDRFWRTALIKDVPEKTLNESRNTKDYIEFNRPKVDKYKSYLINEIKTLEPSLLVPLGEISFNYLTGLNNIRKFRGSVLPPSPDIGIDPDIKILPILGPYPYLSKEYRQTYISRLDFSKISRFSSRSEPLPDKKYNIWVAKTASSLRTFLERSYSDDGLLVFDIETFYGFITCISFCFSPTESVCVPLLDQYIDDDNLILMHRMVAKLLESPIRKVNQNIKYDVKILQRNGFRVNNISGDTFLAMSCLYPEFPKNLGFLVSIYTDLPYFKDEGKEFDPMRYKKDRLYLYNAKDSLGTRLTYDKQLEELNEMGTRQVYNNLITLLPIYLGAEERGIRIDEMKRHKLRAKYQNLFEIELIKFRSLTNNPDINPLSSTQMDTLVYNTLHYKRIKEQSKTEEETLEMLLASEPGANSEILRTLINLRKIHKVIEVIDLPLYPDGRFRAEFNLAGAETGRTTSGKTTDVLLVYDKGKISSKRLGHSLQTIGKHGFSINGVTYGRDIRSMYVPSRGYSFVEIDQSGAEARVDRVLSGIYDMSIFDPPGIHRITGSWIYGCSAWDIKKDILINGVERYYMSKTVRHAAERNLKVDRLMMMTQRPRAECKTILDTFHRFQPEIKNVFHHDIIHEIDTHRALVAPNGRRRDFFDRPGYQMYNEAISYLPQAIVTDQTKLGIMKSRDFTNAYLLIEAHDGVLYEVLKGQEECFYHTFKRNIEVPIDFRQCSLRRDYQLTIPVEGSMGESWYTLRDIK